MKPDKKKFRSSYESDLKKVLNILNKQDDYKLIASGAPLDEFRGEAEAILVAARKANSWRELRNEIHRVFDEAFSGDAGTVQDYDDMAKRILDELSKNES
ncbi:MAG: hypothetical protein IIB00_04115 [candidate division Zixibacteria bacterium]|nr:hypothetical protein [candidate division Zixibacteria bacterium]